MALKWKSKIILAKIETTYGVDPTPTGAANAMLLTDVELRPMEGQDVSRNLELPYMGGQEEIPVGIYATLTGSIELVGSGETGVAPAWGPLLRMCGVAEIVTPDDDPDDGTVEYVPVSDGHESGTLHFWIGPTRHVILGGRATGVVSFNAQGIPVLRATISGLFTLPADTARPSVDLSKFVEPQVATKANTPALTIGGTTFKGRALSLDLGCQVEPRLLMNSEEILIVDRKEALAVTVEAVPMATYNPYQIAQARTRKAIVLEHGTVAGKRVRIEAAQATQRRPTGFENSQNVVEWPLTFNPLPTDAGNDQWKITLS